MKKGYLNNFVNWILDKLATKVYNQLATSNKTMIGALNELNNLLKTQIIDTRSTNKPPQYYYSNYPQTVVYELKESISVDDPFQAAAFLVLQTILSYLPKSNNLCKYESVCNASGLSLSLTTTSLFASFSIICLM